MTAEVGIENLYVGGKAVITHLSSSGIDGSANPFQWESFEIHTAIDDADRNDITYIYRCVAVILSGRAVGAGYGCNFDDLAAADIGEKSLHVGGGDDSVLDGRRFLWRTHIHYLTIVECNTMSDDLEGCVGTQQMLLIGLVDRKDSQFTHVLLVCQGDHGAQNAESFQKVISAAA